MATKHTEKTTKASSAKKIKAKVKAHAKKRPQPKPQVKPTPEAPAVVTAPEPIVLESNNLEYTRQIDGLPFEQQASLIFNPLQGLAVNRKTKLKPFHSLVPSNEGK